MNSKHALALSVAVATIISVAFLGRPETSSTSLTPVKQTSDEGLRVDVIPLSQGTQSPPHTQSNQTKLSPSPSSDEEIQSAFFEKFSSRIGLAKGKIQFIDQLIRYLQQTYGDSWRDYFAEWVSKIFPEQAQQILQAHMQMQAYQTWLTDEKYSLLAMTPAERRAVTWEQRRALFGEDIANEIWQGSLQRERISDSLTQLNSQSDLSFEQQVTQYREAIANAMGSDSESFVQQHQQETIDRFLNVSTVQENLKAMTAEERRTALSTLRADMGMDDAAIQRWETLDATRDARWQAGKQYMAQREGLSDEALIQLQNELFGNEADIIRNEESEGYYRFSRPQVIGLN